MHESTVVTSADSAVCIGCNGKPIRVLHVDDDDSFLKSTRSMLMAEGFFEVETATSVQQAFERMKTESFDAVVSEYMMPEKDGLTFLRELRESGSNVPFIIFTGKGREEVAREALNLGADRYVSKMGDPEAVYYDLSHGLRKAVEAREAVEALRDSEQKFQGISESAGDATIAIDEKGTVMFWNRVAEDIFGYASSDIMGKPLTTIIPEEFRERHQKQFAEGVSSQTSDSSKTYDMVGFRKDGSRFPLEVSFSVWRMKGKNFVTVVARDVTKQKRAWEDLKRAEEEAKKAEKEALENKQKFEGLFRGHPEAAVYLSSDFRILDINSRFSQLFGYVLEEIRNKDINEVIVPNERMDEGHVLDEQAAKGYVYFDTSRKRKDGVLVPVSVSAAPVTGDGKLLGYVATYKDISEAKATESAMKEMMQKLATINEKLSVVGGLTRHDVRNKLSVVTGNAYLLAKKVQTDPVALEYLKDVNSACKQILDIFDFARNYEMLGTEELKNIDVAETVEKAVVLFPDMKKIKVSNECKHLTVIADSLLVRLFYNLIDNSLKYGEKITRIRVYYEKPDRGKLKLIYEDDGNGIAAKEKPNLFKEGQGRGTGYGLYLIKKMMEVYGWTIKETGQPGIGAQFTMTIPKTTFDGKEAYHIG